jgi:ankyrin repeat protein
MNTDDKQAIYTLAANDAYGRTIMHYAAMKNAVEVLEEGLGNGLDVNLADKRANYTPLHMAVQEGACEAAEWLLEHGADVAVPAGPERNPEAMVLPLHIAGSNWRKSADGRMIQILLNHGANKKALNGRGSTAYEQSTHNFGVPEEIKTLLKP